MTAVGTFALPLLDEGRDKVNSRFVGDYIARTETARHSETAVTELVGTLLVRVVADKILAEVFHIVTFYAHIVAEAVRHKESGYAELHHIVDVAVHEL